MSNKDFIANSINSLSSNNWRTREEVLNLIIINILNKIDPDLDYKSLTTALSKLVHDENPKVRFVAQEAISILARNGDEKKLNLLAQQNSTIATAVQKSSTSNRPLTFNETDLMFEYSKLKPEIERKVKIKVHQLKDLNPNLKRRQLSKIITSENASIQKDESFDYAMQTDGIERHKHNSMIKTRKIKL
jgi:hypothetical protein